MVLYEISVDRSSNVDYTSYAVVGLLESGEIEVFGVYYNAEGKWMAQQKLQELRKEEKRKNKKVLIQHGKI